MPCYTKITTKLIDMRFIEAAAKTIGIEISKCRFLVFIFLINFERRLI